MGVKDELRELVDGLSDAEAEAWLRELRRAREITGAGYRALIDDLVASYPPETFRDWPSSDTVDEVVYGR